MKIIGMLVGFTVLFLMGNNIMAQKTVTFRNIKDVPAEKWKKLAKNKIYFGHQSVGFNIMDGVQDVLKENSQIKLRIVGTRKAVDLKKGVFAHSKVGENRKPETKINDFLNVVDQKLSGKPDVVFLKFCYVDVFKQTNVQKLFAQYKQAMEQLKQNYPDLRIIHFTMPLRIQEIGWKVRLKTMLGKDAWEFVNNIKRNEYNKLLKQHYQGKESVFDIACYESTARDGTRSTFKNNGTQYYAMDKEYSDDGGHLNAMGRKIIAEQLLIFLAENNLVF